MPMEAVIPLCSAEGLNGDGLMEPIIPILHGTIGMVVNLSLESLWDILTTMIKSGAGRALLISILSVKKVFLGNSQFSQGIHSLCIYIYIQETNDLCHQMK